MRVNVRPGILEGEVRVPASKSLMQRICAGALLHNGRTVVRNPGRSDDDLVALSIIEKLGAKVESAEGGEIVITSDGVVRGAKEIDCGESGLSCRMFTPIAAMSGEEVSITGRGSLLDRPMGEFARILPGLGVEVSDVGGRLPLTVKGPMRPGVLEVDGSVSSQFLTGVLFALSSAAKIPVTVQVRNLVSRSYVDLSLQVLSQFGRLVLNEGYERFQVIAEEEKEPRTLEMEVEPDWSSASYWLVGGAIRGSVTLRGMKMNSHQGDRAIVDVLRAAGALIVQDQDKLHVRSGRLRSFEYDARQTPDLFPVLAVLAAACEGESRVMGLGRLRHKESDRAKSIMEMLSCFGVGYWVEGEELVVEGRGSVSRARIDGHNDHRIVMSAAVMALMAEGEVEIEGAEAVGKSYPDFFRHLGDLGIHIETQDAV